MSRRRKHELLDSAKWRWDQADKVGFLYLPYDKTKQKLYAITDWQTFSLLTSAIGELRKSQAPTGVRKLLQRFRKPPPVMLKNTAFDLSIEEWKAARADMPNVLVHQPRGRVRRVNKKPEYSPDRPRRHGAVVKTMPRGLRRIKEAQELAPVEGSGPAVEDLDE